MGTFGKRLALIVMLICACSMTSAAKETAFVHKSFDGFSINAKLSTPASGKTDRIVILLGGSGAYDMDLDLTVASKDKRTRILWLKDVSNALNKQDFATIRYNKRPFEFNRLAARVRAAKRKPTKQQLARWKAFSKNPLKHFVEDCKSFARYAKKRFPKAKIYILGGSEGTNVGLWAARELGFISGVALVGFYVLPTSAVLMEQLVYRPLRYFRKMDKNSDGIVTRKEVKENKSAMAMRFHINFDGMDHNHDGRITLTELKGSLLVNQLIYQKKMRSYLIQEAKYPPMTEILKNASFKVLVFQGMWDNQTPAYHSMAVQTLAQKVWKKTNLHFYYFPKLGHCLDPRDDYYDVYYRPIDPKALTKLSSEMNRLFR